MGELSLTTAQELTETLLADMGRPLFPVGIPKGAPRAQLVGTGLLARSVELTESALVLSKRDRQGDLGILMRCLFEHVVVLAWLTGGDAEAKYERMLLWQRHDDEQRLRTDREVSDLQDEPLLPHDVRAQLEADVAEMGKRTMPNLPDRALIADREWAERLAIPLRDIYSTLYRTSSAIVHPTQIGLNLVLTRARDKTIVHAEKPGTGAATLVAVPGLLMDALLISAYEFGRPPLEDAEAMLDRMLAFFSASGVGDKPPGSS